MGDNQDSVYQYYKQRNPETAEPKKCDGCGGIFVAGSIQWKQLDGSVLCNACASEKNLSGIKEREETATVETDLVNHPPHYKQGGKETIDFIQAKLGDEGFEAYCVGNVIKYITRYEHKDQPLQDLQKAQFYLNKAIEIYEKYRMDT